MADTQGQVDIRGIDVQRFVTGFRDEDSVLKKFCKVSTTNSREIRWFQKTAGYVSPTTTTTITSTLSANTSGKSLAPVANQSWTRNTSYVRKYFVESELISLEDERDSDVDVLMTTVRDLLLHIANQVDVRIYAVGTESLSPSNILTGAATQDGWDDAATGNPIYDILAGLQAMRTNRYKIDAKNKPILYINPIEHRNLMNYLISVKGSSIPQFSSALMNESAVMEILGCEVVVSVNATTDYAWIFIPQVTLAWKQFMPLTSEVERYAGKGKKVFVYEEGEALLLNPKSSYLITDTVT